MSRTIQTKIGTIVLSAELMNLELQRRERRAMEVGS
jgi:hypothetical protein